MSIAENITNIKKKLPGGVKLIAVSKSKPSETILEAYREDHKIFGENKVQELVLKYETLPKDIEWHMIGHLQRNKVKYIAPFISLIHGVDSLKLLKEIDKEGKKHNRIIPCLLQIKIGLEESKFGLTQSEAEQILLSPELNLMKNITIRGLMGMATNTDNEETIRSEFRKLNTIFKTIGEKFFPNSRNFTEISMGMSNDYTIALEEGSTLIRIGSLIFGERNYT